MAPTPRILIVEDDPDNIRLLYYVVKQAGYAPIMAQGGREALRLLRESGADLILLDVMMDGLDGWGTLEAVRADERLRSVPVIIVTARQLAEQHDQILDHAGMYQDYVSKPFSVSELTHRIARFLPAAC